MIKQLLLALAVAFSILFQLPAAAVAQPSPASAGLALTPPMGWNTWNKFGCNVSDELVRGMADAMVKSGMKDAGYQYVVIDDCWQTARDSNANIVVDPHFPHGIKPVADYVHSLGLKFGIHILRGIPKRAVEGNLPIAGSSFHASDAADTSETCPWNPDNYGIDAAKPGAQAYYDSIASTYARWGVDLIKVDCISSRPYRGDEIRMLSTALAKTGRPIVLSLSPGAAPLEKIEEMRKYAHLWRISDDIWDLWHSDVPYPQGLGDQFGNVLKWAGKSEPGHWPDADMLPLGYLGPAPGWGKPRNTQLSRDEQRTLMTLWAIFPSPLMIGGDLTATDAWTESLLTNPEVIAVDQHSTDNHPAIVTDNIVVWVAKASDEEGQYVALFNRGEVPAAVQYSWKELGMNAKEYSLRDLWDKKELGKWSLLSVRLPAHACVLYRLTDGK